VFVVCRQCEHTVMADVDDYDSFEDDEEDTSLKKQGQPY